MNDLGPRPSLISGYSVRWSFRLKRPVEFPANSYKSFCIHFYVSDATTTSMHKNTPMCSLKQCKICSSVVGWGREGEIGRQDGMGREGLSRGGGRNKK